MIDEMTGEETAVINRSVNYAQHNHAVSPESIIFRVHFEPEIEIVSLIGCEKYSLRTNCMMILVKLHKESGKTARSYSV